MCEDSIAWGYGSSDWNGYRQWLLEDLAGNNVEYIGSGVTGQMENNANEGRPGERINQTIQFSSAALHQRPNVILLNVGNNDCVFQDDLADAPARLKKLLEDIFEICPDATVVLAMLGPSSNTFYMERFANINDAMPGMAQSFVKRGKHLLIANMSNLGVQSDMFDDLHPNDSGYYRMAKSFYRAIDQANSNGWIHEPVSVPRKTLVLETTCTSLPSWEQLPLVFAGFMNAPDNAKYFFADVDGDSREDLIVLAPDGTAQPYINLPNPIPEPGKIIAWWPAQMMHTPVSSEPDSSRLLLADLTGATFSSFIYINPDGSIFAAQNLGPDPTQGQIVFKDPVLIANSSHERPDPLGVRFNDIDGDGRADLLYITPTGGVKAWLNRADLQKHSTAIPEPNALNIEWVPRGEIVETKMVGDVARQHIRLADLNGDGMADYLWVNPDDGSVEAWLNKGIPGKSKPAKQSELKPVDKPWWEKNLLSLVPRHKKRRNGNSEIESKAEEKSSEKLLSKLAEVEEKSSAQKSMTKSPSNASWAWEDLGVVFDKAGRGDNRLHAGVGSPGITFADVAGSRRAAYLQVEQNGAVWGWGNVC